MKLSETTFLQRAGVVIAAIVLVNIAAVCLYPEMAPADNAAPTDTLDPNKPVLTLIFSISDGLVVVDGYGNQIHNGDAVKMTHDSYFTATLKDTSVSKTITCSYQYTDAFPTGFSKYEYGTSISMTVMYLVYYNDTTGSASFTL
jgi:hypothetical protein